MSLSTTINPHACKVALLAGGISDERDISLKSAEGAKIALEEAGFAVEQFDPADDAQMEALAAGSYDVAFLCVHGKGGEDGTLQQKLEDMNLPYTGSGVAASALAMNKASAKDAYVKAGIKTPQSCVFRVGDEIDAHTVSEAIGTKCVAKAASGGSTIGIFIAEDESQIEDCVKRVFEYDDEAVVESFVAGDEFTVAVIGNDELLALPVIQIIPQNGFYDFDSKYLPGGSQHLCPAPVSDALFKEMQDTAILAHRALGCRGVSRTDFIVDSQQQCWVLETNTIPGMTSTSLLPDAARVAGISFPELCAKFIEWALECQ